MAIHDIFDLEPAAIDLLVRHAIKGIRGGSVSLPQLRALAAALGVEVVVTDFSRDDRECEVLAPPAHNWGAAASDLHILLAVAHASAVPFRPSYNDLVNRMIDGPVHCEPGCDCGWDVEEEA
jgi:hypothetical protein